MLNSDIFEFLSEWFPTNKALPYDNVGLLVGNKNDGVNTAVIALDCTNAVVDFAIKNKATLIITHHPLIFNPIKTVTADSIVYRLIKNGISLICMHTNLDTATSGLNDLLAETLNLKNISVITDEEMFTFRIGDISPVTPDKLAKFVNDRLKTRVKYTSGNKEIKRVAVCSGSGGNYYSLAKQNGADALITADIKHNCFIDAFNDNFTLIDAGHFETENIVVDYLISILSKQFKDVAFLPFTVSPILYV